MEAFRVWLLGMIAASMLLSVLHALLPKNAAADITGVSMGLVLLMVVLRPLATADWEHLRLRYTEWEEKINSQIEEYQEDSQNDLSRIIAEQTGAYISDKAAQLGLHCTVRVDTELREQVPYPAAVHLDIPRHEALSRLIEQDLDISRENQYWSGG